MDQIHNRTQQSNRKQTKINKPELKKSRPNND